jgi:CBS domain-containing protein
MKTIQRLRRSGVAVAPECTVRAAAQAMEAAGVGALAVVDGRELVGIVTDRDLVRRGLARDCPPDGRVDGLMSSPVVTVPADAELHDVYEVFRTHALRRLAVVDDGGFVGILSLDDLLVDLSRDLFDLARPVADEIVFAQRDAPPLVASPGAS